MGGEEDEEDEEVKLFESFLFWYKIDHKSGADGNSNADNHTMGEIG